MPAIEIHTITCPPVDSNCFLIVDRDSDKVLAVDPGITTAKKIPEFCRNESLELEAIFITHGHIDHYFEVADLLETHPVEVMAHAETEKHINNPDINGEKMLDIEVRTFSLSRKLTEGDCIDVGALRFHVMETPGHMTGSLSLHGEGVCFTGDFLMRHKMGHWDLLGSSKMDMIQSVKKMFATLDDAVILHTGHGPDSTIGHERKHNPYLTEWI